MSAFESLLLDFAFFVIGYGWGAVRPWCAMMRWWP